MAEYYVTGTVMVVEEWGYYVKADSEDDAREKGEAAARGDYGSADIEVYDVECTDTEEVCNESVKG